MSRAFNAYALLTGRILIGAFFLLNGIILALNFAAATEQFAKLGIAGIDPLWLAISAIAVQVLGGALLIVRWHARLIALVLAVYFTISTIMVYGAIADVSVAMSYLKNIAIVGALLYISATN